jgi:sugar transferase (PEP-CTERM system associated)
VLTNQKYLGPFVVLVVADFCVTICSVYLAASVRFAGDFIAVTDNVGILWYRALIFAAATVVALFSLGMLRTKHRDRFLRTISSTTAAVILSTSFMALISYTIPQTYLGRGVLGLSALFTLVGLIIFRYLFNHIVDEGYFKRRILILGAGPSASTIEDRMRRRTDRRSFRIVGYIPCPEEKICIDPLLVISVGLKDVAAYARMHEIDEVVVAIEERRHCLPIQELLELRLAGTRITEIDSFWEQESGRLKLDVLKPSSLVFSEGFSASTWALTKKRAMDVVAATVLLVLAAPVMAIVALAIFIESGFRGPILYRQMRVGHRGQPFEMIKFRSMVVDAEKDGIARWAEKSDPRITKVGRVLRGSRLDELPQLLNITKGNMSFVGPRPERPEFVEELTDAIPYYPERHLAKPGITGWAQLSYPYGASVEDAREKLQFDLYYLKHQSMLLDLLIILRTVEVVFTGHGAR